MQVALLLEQMDYTFGHGGWFKALNQAVAGLTAEQAAWSPGEGVHSVWESVNHLSFWKEKVAARLGGAPLTGGRINNDSTFSESRTDEAAWQAALERLVAAQRAYREAVASLSDERLEAPLPGERTPLKELLMSLNLHDTYHLGQMVAVRKLQKAWPGGAA